MFNLALCSTIRWSKTRLQDLSYFLGICSTFWDAVPQIVEPVHIKWNSSTLCRSSWILPIFVFGTVLSSLIADWAVYVKFQSSNFKGCLGKICHSWFKNFALSLISQWRRRTTKRPNLRCGSGFGGFWQPQFRLKFAKIFSRLIVKKYHPNYYFWQPGPSHTSIKKCFDFLWWQHEHRCLFNVRILNGIYSKTTISLDEWATIVNDQMFNLHA